MMNIEYCIDLFPVVNASVDIYHNWIILYLFSIITAFFKFWFIAHHLFSSTYFTIIFWQF